MSKARAIKRREVKCYRVILSVEVFADALKGDADDKAQAVEDAILSAILDADEQMIVDWFDVQEVDNGTEARVRKKAGR